MKLPVLPALAVSALFAFFSQAEASAISGAGIGASTGSSRSTSTSSGLPDRLSDRRQTISGSANVGHARSTAGTISSSPPDTAGMVTTRPSGRYSDDDRR